jgi:transcriptional regulator GlxA family with amidase domain
MNNTRQRLRGAATSSRLSILAAREASSFATQMAIIAWELSATGAAPRDSVRNRARLARRAEGWMRDHLAEPITIPDICLAMRVSRRELEYAFRNEFDESPRSCLEALRLNSIRRALQTDDDHTKPLGRIAVDHGMTHLGRFAARYRTMYGEAPSQTRCRTCEGISADASSMRSFADFI